MEEARKRRGLAIEANETEKGRRADRRGGRKNSGLENFMERNDEHGAENTTVI